MTNISNFISQLEPSAPTKILLGSKIPTGVSLLSITGAIVNPLKHIPIKIISNHLKCCPQKMIQFQIKIVTELSTNEIQLFHHF